MRVSSWQELELDFISSSPASGSSQGEDPEASVRPAFFHCSFTTLLSRNPVVRENAGLNSKRIYED